MKMKFKHGEYEVELVNKGMIKIENSLHKCNLNETLHKGCKECIYEKDFIYNPETRQCEFREDHVFRYKGKEK